MGITCGLLYAAKEMLFDCDCNRVIQCAVNSRHFLLEWATQGVDAHQILRALTMGGCPSSAKRFGLGLMNPAIFQLVDEGSVDERLILNSVSVDTAEAHFSKLGKGFPYRVRCPALAVQQDEVDMISDALNWASEVAREHWSLMLAEGEMSAYEKSKRRRPARKKARKPKGGKRK